MQYNIRNTKMRRQIDATPVNEDLQGMNQIDSEDGYHNYFNKTRSHHFKRAVSLHKLHNRPKHPTGFPITLLIIYSYLTNSNLGIICTNNEIEGSNVHCEIVQPMTFDHRLSSRFIPFLVHTCPDNLEIFIESNLGDGDDEFVINLVKNKRLIDETYFKVMSDGVDNLGHPIHHSNNSSGGDDDAVNFYNNHQFISLHNFRNNDDHCHYHGLVNENLKSTSAISIVDSHLLSGFFYDGQQHSYHLEADTINNRTLLRRITDINQLNEDSSLCQEHLNSARSDRSRRDTSMRTGGSSKRRRFPKSNPNNKILHAPFQSNSSSLYVQLLVVHDHSQFKDYNGNTTLIAERTMQIVNIMNAFYKQLNIFVALVGVVLWTEKDEIKLTDDGDATLTNFLKYRYEKLLPRYHHDNAQLITSTSFNGSVVGKALKGPICTYDHSGGVNTDHSHIAAIVAVTLSHELGHNLGMEHDEDDKCKCPDEKCIMSSSSSTVHPKHWSTCSIQYLEDSRKHGLLDCLINEPTDIFGPVCGNGFVEEGEDCDIGELIPIGGTSRSRSGINRHYTKPNHEFLNQGENPCCDRTTCKFVGNATCAQGACCDLAQCSVYNGTETRVCRPRKTECDLEEVCDGQSEYCPPDVHYHDGIECGPTVNLADGLQPVADSEIYNKSRAYCYNGRCASHESQCQLLWGPTATTSRDICYDQNVHGNTSGNCGYDRIEKRYGNCEPTDTICGMLHCVHDQTNGPNSDPNRKTGKLGYGFESASVLTVSFFIMSNHAKIYCHGAIVDAGPGMQDPGLVPNGAACGDEQMCLNQKCVPIQEVLHENWCPSDCNGNGICDNMGVCHCNDGTIGTSCYQFFGSNFHLSVMLYIIMFFGPMIVILVLAFKHYREQFKIWWFLHNRKIALKSKAREPNQQRRMAYNVDGHKVSISEPIPMSQPQHNTQRPFFDPLMDPWAETSYDGGKSPGYRLEPLNNRQQQPPPPPIPDYNLDSGAHLQTTASTSTSLRPGK